MCSGIGVVWGGFDVLGAFLLTKPTPSPERSAMPLSGTPFLHTTNNDKVIHCFCETDPGVE